MFPSAEWKTFPPRFFPSCHVSPNAPSGKSLRKPPELATRSERLAYTSRKPRVRRRTSECDFTGSLRKRHVSREAYFPGHTAVAPRVPSEPEPQTTRMPPGSPANHPRKTLPGTRRVRRVSIIPGTTLLFIIENSRKWL